MALPDDWSFDPAGLEADGLNEDGEFGLEEIAQAHQTQGVPSSIAQPGVPQRRNEGWSSSGILLTGRDAFSQAILSVPGLAPFIPLLQKSVPSFTLQCNFAEHVKGAGDYTVQFNVLVNPADAGNTTFILNPEAVITWTVKGNQTTRHVTVGNGVSLSGTAEAVRIEVFDSSPNSSGGGIVPINYSVSIEVAPGIRGTTEVPPTLVLFTPGALPGLGTSLLTVPGGGFLLVPVPQDAGANEVFITAWGGVPDPALGSIRVEHRPSAAGVVLKRYDPRQFDDWVPLAPGTTTIELINNVGNPSVDFTITLGIEG